MSCDLQKFRREECPSLNAVPTWVDDELAGIGYTRLRFGIKAVEPFQGASQKDVPPASVKSAGPGDLGRVLVVQLYFTPKLCVCLVFSFLCAAWILLSTTSGLSIDRPRSQSSEVFSL
jgi:hypothetical protein